MAQLGIIGGMGPQATQDFYQQILDFTDSRRDQDHLPTLILNDTQIPDRTISYSQGVFFDICNRLERNANILAEAGCTHLAMPCNTAHQFIDVLKDLSPVPFLDMVELTVERVVRKKYRKVGLLATEGTIKMKFYHRALEAKGIEVVLPNNQARVSHIIYDLIKRGHPGEPKDFYVTHDDLVRQGCDSAILACTELSVFRNRHGLPDFYIDSTEILARGAIKACGYPLRRKKLYGH